MSIQNPFILNNKEYKTNLFPEEGYNRQMAKVIQLELGCDLQTAQDELKGILETSDVKDPLVAHYDRDKNNDRVPKQVPLTQYIRDTIKRNEIIVPSFTTYISPKKFKALDNGFILENLSYRTKYKKISKLAKVKGDEQNYKKYDVLQKVKKLFNNSVSGSYASASTIKFVPSAHYSLTTMTRCVASIGNAITESMVSGNRHYSRPDVIYNHIAALVSNIDQIEFKTVIDKYEFYCPTSEEVLQVVLRSSKPYWKDEAENIKLLDFINKLNEVERAIVVYVNDFYHLRVFNPEKIKKLLNILLRRVPNPQGDPAEIVDNAIDFTSNLAKHILSKDIRGKEINTKVLKNSSLLKLLAGTIENLEDKFPKIQDLISTFYVTDVMPIDIGNIKDFFRECIVLSDTDSTCATYDEWVTWMYGKVEFSSRATGLSALIMTFATQTMNHYLKILTVNMNADLDDADLLKMKPEFYWEVFNTANKSKHYFAQVNIVEGNVYKEPELELKGAHLIASKVPEIYRKIAHDMMIEINNTVTSNKSIDITSFVTRVAEVERDILNKVRKGDTSVLKKERINDEKAYAKPGMDGDYSHYLLWDEVFAPKYGKADVAPIMVSTVNLKLDKDNRFKKFVDELDGALGERFKEFVKVRKKKTFGTFRIPNLIGITKGIPEEVIPFIDEYKVVKNNCNVFYNILEILGFFIPDGQLVTDMGY